MQCAVRSARALAPSLAAAAPRTFAGEADRIIAIDRSGLSQEPAHSHNGQWMEHKEPETQMARHIKSIIRVRFEPLPPRRPSGARLTLLHSLAAINPCWKMCTGNLSALQLAVLPSSANLQFRGGPVTLAEYMSEVLTNPEAGYYTQRDVFGAAGDFTTSPEISQMFGEMVGIWCVAMWEQLGKPPALRLVELGPGRGTMMADLLRGTAPFAAFAQSLSVAMVEVSPVLQRLQRQALRCGDPDADADAAGAHARSGLGAGASVSWHRSLEDVPAAAADGAPTLYIVHEFVDALPVHQFQRTDRAWCERLVDVASPDSPLHLRLVLSPGATPAARTLLPLRLEGLPLRQRAALSAIEVCPQGMALAQALAARVGAHGGAALIVDYGQDAPYEGSLQAIARHKFVGLLEQPGTADLSARVDFDALRHAVERSGAAAACHGPIPQAEFLGALGIRARAEQLVEAAEDAAAAAAVVQGYRRLVSGSDGGQVRREGQGGHGAEKSEQQGEGGGEEVEGLGYSYKAMCIAARGGAAPVAFAAAQAQAD
jgi:NADH dehydrogenase [ubiquinone] 1 alpha subcomplex assembly factor 7